MAKPSNIPAWVSVIIAALALAAGLYAGSFAFGGRIVTLEVNDKNQQDAQVELRKTLEQYNALNRSIDMRLARIEGRLGITKE